MLHTITKMKATPLSVQVELLVVMVANPGMERHLPSNMVDSKVVMERLHHLATVASNSNNTVNSKVMVSRVATDSREDSKAMVNKEDNRAMDNKVVNKVVMDNKGMDSKEDNKGMAEALHPLPHLATDCTKVNGSCCDNSLTWSMAVTS